MITAPYISEQTCLGIKTEASYGTTASLSAATDFIYVEGVDLKVDHKQIERNYYDARLSAPADVPGSTLYTISFDTEYQTSGSAGNVLAPYSAIEQAAGMFVSASATNVTYLLQHTASANFPCPGKSATIQVYYKDKLYTLTGVYGNLQETHRSDGVVKLKFNGTGIYNSESLGTFPTPSYKENYVKVASASLRLHDSYDGEFSEVTIDYGVAVTQIPYAGTANGISKIMITGRKPTIKIKTLMDSKANHDFVGKMVAKTAGSISYTVGTGAGNVITYAIPSSQYRSVDVSDSNGVYMFDVTANIVNEFTKVIS
jgi:hypothetical protein